MTVTAMPSASARRLAPAPSAEESPANDRPDGGWLFTVVHGPVEDAADQALIEDLAETATRLGALATWVRDDRVTWVFDTDRGRAAVLAMSGLATTRGRFWWRTHTRFGGDA